MYTDKLNIVNEVTQPVLNIAYTMRDISWCAVGFIALAGVIFLVRKKITTQKSVVFSSTWGCGYVGDTSKMQYTASSFVRTYRKLAEPLLSLHKEKREITGIFPKKGWHEIHPYDKIEKWLVDKPVKAFKLFLGRFLFLQNGRLQSYILYGVIFIIALIFIPMIFEKIGAFIAFLKQL